jgi:Flp pilus assembly protein TadD
MSFRASRSGVGATPEKSFPQRRWQRFLPLLLLMLVLGPFITTLRNEFVSYDDPAYVTENIVVQDGFTWHGLGWAFGWHASNWHPLTWYSHMLDCQIYGLKPWGHHFTSIVLHSVNAVLLFMVLSRMTGMLWRSFFVAACFGLHPLRVESVAWVSERKDVLSMFFFLLALWAYARFVEARRVAARPLSHSSAVDRNQGTRFYLLVLVFLALGLMSKPMLVTTPFVLLLLDYWPLERYKRSTWTSLIVEKIPLLILAIGSCALTFISQKIGGAMEPTTDVIIKLRVENALISYVRYIGKLFYPLHLAALYPRPAAWPIEEVTRAGLFLVAISVSVFLVRRSFPYLVVGWFWFLGTMIPVIGLVQVGVQSIADRYTYLPTIGLTVAGVWGVCDLTRAWRWRRPLLCVAGVLVLTGCLGLTLRQIGDWHDSERLYRQTIAETGENFIASTGLGMVLYEKHRLDEAAECFKEALRVAPTYAAAHGYYSFLLLQQGQLDEALRQSQQAVRLRPGVPAMHGYLGVVLARLNRLDEAIAEYQTALRLGPCSGGVYAGLGHALIEKGRFQKALEACREAVRRRPDLPGAQYDFAVALVRTGHPDEGIQHFQETLRLQPDLYEARNDFGIALAAKGRWDDAVWQYREAIKANPDFASPHKNLAHALTALGRPEEAIQNLQVAVKLAPTDGETHFELAAALISKQRLDEAIPELLEAARLQTKDARPHYILGCAFAEKGRLDEAIAQFKQAVEIQPDHANALAYLGRALEAQGHPAEAVEPLRKAAELEPRNAETRNVLGASLAENGNLEEAIAQFGEALKLKPDYGEARTNLANALAAKTSSQKP